MKEEYTEDISALITSAISVAVGYGFNVSDDLAKIMGSIAPCCSAND